MATKVQIVPGPPTSGLSKAEAEKKLRAHPEFPKNASTTLDEVEGRWVAAIAVESAPPAFLDKGPSTDDAENEDDGPPTEDKAPDESEPKDDGPSDDADGPPKPDEDDGDKGKGGEKAELGKIVDMFHVLFEALGLPTPGGPDDNPVPDEIGPPPGGPDAGGPPPPPGAGGKPGVKPSPRPLKPGDTPPGGTPVGAPSFASVSDDHPWKKVAQEVASFWVEEPIGNQKLGDVERELRELAEPLGLNVRELQPRTNAAGERTAAALISHH